MTVKVYSPVLPSVEVFGAHEGIASATGINQTVSLTFTPTEGTLVVVPYGDTVSQLQLEVGPTPSSYIPTEGSEVTRAADIMTVPAANMPWSSSAVSIQMEGTMTGADSTLAEWSADASNNILVQSGSNDFTFTQEDGGTVDTVTGGSFTAGINVPFNIASRHGSTFINGAVDGIALTANTTPTALPDLSTTDFEIGPDFMGNISKLRVWADDIGDGGIEEASS